MNLTYQFSTIFSSSYSFINPKLPNFNHTSHKFKTFFSYQPHNSLHDANLKNPDAKISSLSKTLKYKIDAENKIQKENRLFYYNSLIKFFKENKDFEKAENLFDEMLQRGIKPDTFTFSNIIRCAALCSLPHKAVEFFEKMPSFGCEPDYIVISSMIYVYASAGNVDMALKFYDSAKNEKFPISSNAFSALINMYEKLGNYDGCLGVYDDMKVLGIKPKKMVYNTLLAAMGRAKRSREANGIYLEMRRDGFEPSWATYSALLEAYSRGRYSEGALSLYKEMKEKGMTLNKFLYSMVIDMCAKVGYIDEAVEIFEEMKQSGTCRPNSFIYSSLINMYACNGNVLEAEAMLNEMINCGLERNIFVLTSFVHCYGKAKRADDIVKIFDQFLDIGITPDDRLCACLLYVMTKIPTEELGKISNCIEKANPKLGFIVSYLTEEKEDDGNFMKEVLELLSSAKESVKKTLCNSLIDLCYYLGVQDRARDLLGLGLTLKIYSDIQSRSETQWCLNLKTLSIGAAMTALHVWIDDLSKAFESGEELPQVLGIWRRNDSDSVFESYLKELNSPFHKDTALTGWFFTTSQDAKSWLQSRGSTETVADLINPKTLKSKRIWMQPKTAISSLNSCDHNEQQVSEILSGLGDNVKERDAKHILLNISNSEIAILALRYFQDKIKSERHVILYNPVFKLLREIKDFERAEKLFDEMLQRGIKPNILTFSNLIRCAVMCSLPHKAVELFERMPSFGCEPDYNVSSSMIYVYAHMGNVDMALELYDRAKNEKWSIWKMAFSALIMMYGKLGNYDGCLSVYNDTKVLGVRPNMALYNTLLYAMGKAKRPKYAKGVYEEMRKNGFEPNCVTYSALLEAYSRGLYSKEALSLYKEMKQKGMAMNKFLYCMLLNMCADVGYIDEGVEIFEDMKRSRTCQPDNFIYSSLIDMYACNGKVLEAESMLKEMTSCGFEPNIVVFTIFVHCYGKAKRTDDVVNIFNQFWDFGITPDDRLCDCLLYVMTQIPKEELGKITNCIDKANPKLGYIVTYLMEEKEDDGYFMTQVSELLSSAEKSVKKSFCNNLINICYNLGMEDRARNLLGLGLTLKIYGNVQSRCETQWCLNLKKLSVGVAMTALHVWLDDLSKAFESGKKLPQKLGICCSHKPSDKDLASVFESYLKELNSPFHKDTVLTGWFFTTSQEAKSWLQSRGSNETVADLNSTVLDVPAEALPH